MGKLVGAVAVSLAVAGCASIEFKKLEKDTTGVYGLRFWRPVPYLLVAPGAGGFCESKIFYAPDEYDVYAMELKPGFGSVKKPTLDEGWKMTGIEGNYAESKIADSAATALASVAGIITAAKAPAAFAADGGKAFPEGVQVIQAGIWRLGRAQTMDGGPGSQVKDPSRV